MKILIKTALALLLLWGIDTLVDQFMIRGVKTYYGLNQHADLLLVGHSHLMLATDKTRLENELGLRVSKYCREGVNVSDRQIMVDHFLNSGYADSLKTVLYGVDLCTFTGEGLSKNSYKLFYPFMDDSHVDAYIRTQAPCDDYWLHKLLRSSRYNDEGVKNSALRGWFRTWSNFKNNRIDIETYRLKLANGDERHIRMNSELIEQFRQTVSALTSRGIRVILVNTPTLDLLNDFEPEKYETMMAWFRTFADNDPLVEFWDFNPDYSSDYEIFSDRLHLNRRGQEVITGEIIKRLKNTEKR